MLHQARGLFALLSETVDDDAGLFVVAKNSLLTGPSDLEDDEDSAAPNSEQRNFSRRTIIASAQEVLISSVTLSV